MDINISNPYEIEKKLYVSMLYENKKPPKKTNYAVNESYTLCT